MPPTNSNAVAGANPVLDRLSFPSELGWMAVAAGPTTVTRLVFGYRSSGAAERALSRDANEPPTEDSLADAVAGKEPIDLVSVSDRLQRFAAGEPVDLAAIPVETAHLTPFGRDVLAACKRLAWGETISYGQLAARCGKPGAARAVGSVMAKNRVPLIVPCHRVLGAGGKLGGYSAPDGLATKRRLLNLEQS